MYPHDTPNSTSAQDPSLLEAQRNISHVAIDQLAALGCGFTLFAAKQKGPRTKGWQHTANLHTAAEAQAHLQRGGNVGVGCGSGGVYLYDFDGHAERAAQFPELDNALTFWRDTAPARSKIAFRCNEHLRGVKYHNHDIELLAFAGTGGHQNAVIAGTHDSGAMVRASYTEIPTLTADQVSTMLDAWTNGEHSRRMATGAGDPAYMLEVDPGADGVDLLEAAISQANMGNRDDTGFALACGLRDRLMAQDDAKHYMLKYQASVPQERGHYYTVQHAMQSLRSAYSKPPRTPQTKPEDLIAFHEGILAEQSWLLTADAANVLKDARVKADTGRAILRALLDYMAEWGRADVWPGLRKWACRSGCALSTLQNNLPKLVAAEKVTLTPGENPGDATAYRVELQNRYTPPKHAGDANNKGKSLNNLHGVPELSFYGDHLSDDAFKNNHAAYRKRHPNGIEPLGRNNLIVWVALKAGHSTVKAIAEESGLHRQTVRRMLARDYEHGLVTYTTERHNVRHYALTANAVADLDILRPHMTTYGVQLRRELDVADKHLQYTQRFRGDDVQRVNEARVRYNQAAWANGWTGENPAQHVKYRRRQSRYDTAERNAELSQVCDEVQRLRHAGMTTAEIRLKLAYAGYEAADVSRAMVSGHGAAIVVTIHDDERAELAELAAKDRAGIEYIPTAKAA